MAYTTLSDKQSRGEYDEYMQTCYKYATLWMHDKEQDEVERERLEKIQERRRKRILRQEKVERERKEEEEFFSNFQSRTGGGGGAAGR